MSKGWCSAYYKIQNISAIHVKISTNPLRTDPAGGVQVNSLDQSDKNLSIKLSDYIQ
jgi:hypothetical protein